MPRLTRLANPVTLALALALVVGALGSGGERVLHIEFAQASSTSSTSGGSSSGASSAPGSPSSSSPSGSSSSGSSSSGSSSASPSCIPSHLNRSAILPGTQLMVSPLPDTFDASADTQISLLGVPAQMFGSISVTASKSGTHTGTLEAYSQGDGASFMPTKPFDVGETVTVRGSYKDGRATVPFAFRFTTADPVALGHPDVAATVTAETSSANATTAPVPSPPASTGSSTSATRSSASASARAAADTNGATSSPKTSASTPPPTAQTFHSRPDLEPPVVTVDASSPNAATGDIFTTPYSGPGQVGPMIFNDSGQLVWFDPLPRGIEATNLQEQQYLGQPVLTWWEGYIPPQGFGQGEDLIANSAYEVVAHVAAGNGYQADLHDFQLTPQGTALMTIFSPIRCDLRAYGGPSDGAITDGVFQEIDVKTGLVEREWHAIDHVKVTATYSNIKRASVHWPLDFFHINSIAQGIPKVLLLSSRNTWGLYEVDASSGQVIQRIGGKYPTLKMGSDTSTAWQHDARVLPNGMISVFDNGATPKIHTESRGVVLSVNPQTDTTTLVRQFTHAGDLLAGSQGNFQTLSNGDAFLGWGAEPYVSEYSPTGQLLWDAVLPKPYESYRAFRFIWSGQPPSQPAIAATAGSGGKLTVDASWNGATTVASWLVLAGTSAAAAKLKPVTTVPRDGFETTISTTSTGPYVEVQAQDATGQLLATSKVIKASPASH